MENKKIEDATVGAETPVFKKTKNRVLMHTENFETMSELCSYLADNHSDIIKFEVEKDVKFGYILSVMLKVSVD